MTSVSFPLVISSHSRPITASVIPSAPACPELCDGAALPVPSQSLVFFSLLGLSPCPVGRLPSIMSGASVHTLLTIVCA